MGKTRKICLRITEEEYQKLLEDTKAAGIPRDNISEYLRRQLRLFRPERLVESDHWKELAYQIRKIGINVNQIVSRHNSRLYFPSDKEQLKKDLEEIRMLLDQAMEEGMGDGDHETTSHETGETIRKQPSAERDCVYP